MTRLAISRFSHVRLLCALLVAGMLWVPAAVAAPWHVRTLGTGEETFLRGLDARPDRVLVLVDQRRHAGTNRLELRIAGTYRVLDLSAHNFDDVRVGHDDNGDVIVAWARVPDTGGARQAFVWTAQDGRRQITTGSRSVSALALAVANDGSAVLAAASGEGVVAARRPVAGRFGAPENVAPATPVLLAAGAGPGGRALIAWGAGATIQSVQAPADGDFGPVQTTALTGTEVRTLAAASDPDGRVVVAAQVVERTGGVDTGGLLEAVDWPADATGLSAPLTLSSNGAFAGTPAIVARAGVVVIGWTESTGEHIAARVLHTIRWPAGSSPSAASVYRPARGMGGFAAPLPTSPLPGAAGRFFYRPSIASNRWYTVWIDGAGRAHGASSVTPPSVRSDADLQATLASAGSTAAWTTKLGSTNATYRVQIATP